MSTSLKKLHVREALLERIRSGHYRPGNKLPSERQLAQDLDLSHLTVRRGLEELVQAGVIIKRPRVGNFVQQVRAIELAQRVAIVLPRFMSSGTVAHPVTGLMIQGAMSELDQRDCALSLISYDCSQFWLDAGEAMLARGVTGALVWANADTPTDQMEKLARSGIKTVLLHGEGLWPELRFSSVSIDAHSVMREAVQKLMDLGHRRISWISYVDTRFKRFEVELIREFAERYQLPNPEQIIRRLPDYPSAAGVLTQLLQEENRPTAVIVQDEFMADAAFRACHQLELRVPRDLSLVAIHDSLPQAHLVPLSAPGTVGLWIDGAKRAARHLKGMMDQNSEKQIEVVLHAPIQWKESTSTPSSQ